MPARRRRGILHRLKTQRALSRLAEPTRPRRPRTQPLHCLPVREIDPRRVRQRRVRHRRELRGRRGRVRVRRREQQRIVTAQRAGVERDLDGAGQDGAGGPRCGFRLCRSRGRRGLHVQVGLDGELRDEQHAEDLVAGAVFGVVLSCEDVPEVEDAFG